MKIVKEILSKEEFLLKVEKLGVNIAKALYNVDEIKVHKFDHEKETLHDVLNITKKRMDELRDKATSLTIEMMSKSKFTCAHLIECIYLQVLNEEITLVEGMMMMYNMTRQLHSGKNNLAVEKNSIVELLMKNMMDKR